MNETRLSHPKMKRRQGVFAYLFDLLGGRKITARSLDTNRLAVDRTRMAHERTLMAWIRTGLALISFGFTIYKFFQIEGSRAATFKEGLLGARGYGSLMIITGLVAVFLAALQHRREMQSLRAAGIEVTPSLATIVAALVSILGLVGLLLVVFKQ